jgi:hypothetical protein
MKRINCYVERRQEQDRTNFALIARPGLTIAQTAFGSSPSRGLWAVNSLSSPIWFTVHDSTLYSVTNGGLVSTIGTIGSSVGDVSMADDGKYLVLVDGTHGYWYNMQTPGALTLITDGNFTTAPLTVTWQDNYFIVASSSATRQFQLSQISPSIDPAVWPSVQINFAGAGSGPLKAGRADHSILYLFGDTYTEFWQDTGSPDFPYALIPGSAQQFGLASTWSLTEFDNSLVGLFRNEMGALTVARLQGFSLKRLSDSDMEKIWSTYPPAVVNAAQAFSFQLGGHPMYVISFSNTATWMYDGASNVWSELKDAADGVFWGRKFSSFLGQPLLSDYRNGNIYTIDPTKYADNDSNYPVEVWTKHIWNDDKYIGISQLQVDIASGVGLVTGQGSSPVVDLQVSKDGGHSFFSVGFSSMGKVGDYTDRVIWRTLGAARDWVLKLRITDPVKRVITGASAEMMGAPF